MKHLTIAAAAAFMLLGTAHAQQATSPLYGEVGYTHLSTDTGFGKANPGMIRGIVGYEFHPFVAAEGMLAFGVREDSVSGTALGVPFTADVKVQHSYGVFVKPKFSPTNGLEVFGRLGYAQSKVRFDVNTAAGSGSASDSDGDFAYGAGVSYRFSPRAHVSIDWMRYYDKSSTTVDGVTISVGMRF